MSKSLYERLGGAAGISVLVDAVVAAHMNNPLIKARFLPYLEKPGHLAEVKKRLREWAAADRSNIADAACPIPIAA